MKKIVFFVILSAAFSCTQKETAPTADIWQSLILSPSLDGWKQSGSISATIADSTITLSTVEEAGSLIYESGDEFEDFRFETQFMLPQNSTAGVAFRYNDAVPGDPASIGYVVNLDHNPDQQNTLGSIINIARAKVLKGTKDNWNKLTVEARGDHLKVFINDTLVTETHDRRSLEGKIGFVVGPSSMDVKFRSPRIMPFEENDALPPQIEDYMRRSSRGEFISLIQPDKLDDWSQVGDATWTLSDGVLTGKSGAAHGFLIHKTTFRNFYLKVKFKISHEHNSGFFIRHTPDSTGNVTIQNAIECNIYDHDGYLHEFSTGAIPPYIRAWSKMVDYDDWNMLEIFAFNEQVCMIVNGVKASDVHLPEMENRSGQICLQAGIQVFNGNLPSEVTIKELQVKSFDDVPYIGY